MRRLDTQLSQSSVSEVSVLLVGAWGVGIDETVPFANSTHYCKSLMICTRSQMSISYMQ